MTYRALSRRQHCAYTGTGTTLFFLGISASATNHLRLPPQTLWLFAVITVTGRWGRVA